MLLKIQILSDDRISGGKAYEGIMLSDKKEDGATTDKKS